MNRVTLGPVRIKVSKHSGFLYEDPHNKDYGILGNMSGTLWNTKHIVYAKVCGIMVLEVHIDILYPQARGQGDPPFAEKITGIPYNPGTNHGQGFNMKILGARILKPIFGGARMKVQHVLPKTSVQSCFSEASSIKFESQLMRRPLVVVVQYTLAESTLSRSLRFSHCYNTPIPAEHL